MIIAVFGDTHGHLDLMYAMASAWQNRTKIKIDYVFQVGDLGIWPSPESLDRAGKKHVGEDDLPAGGNFRSYATGEQAIPIPTYFVRGNHESQSFLRYHELIQQALYPDDYWERAIEICPNLYWIPDGHIVSLEGVSPFYQIPGGYKTASKTIRVAGLGGNFAYKTWKQGLEYWQIEGRRMNHMTRDRFERLVREEADILLTHDAPTGLGLHGNPGAGLPADEKTGSGVPAINHLIMEMGIRRSFSGHWHEYAQAKIGESNHIALDKVDPHFPEARCMEVFEA